MVLNRFYVVYAVLAVAGFAGRADGQGPKAESTPMHRGRQLVWQDEFKGNELDDRKWRFRRSMNSSDCAYANDARTYSVEDGFLKLRVQPSDNPKKLFLVPRRDAFKMSPL